MTDHRASITWRIGEGALYDGRYSRTPSWSLDGGATIRVSASPHIISPPWRDPSAIDPEEAVVAAAASCHMLFFLALAVQERARIVGYQDEAVGKLACSERGIALHPSVQPGRDVAPGLLAALHDEAHRSCHIANSLSCDVIVKLQERQA
jgi:organic hydroperoxide reductase OsmC/OhrA